VKVVGPIEYGQPSAVARYTGKPRYDAYGFNARPGDRVDAEVKARSGRFQAWITDGSFRPLAGGEAHVAAKIPEGGPPGTTTPAAGSKLSEPRCGLRTKPGGDQQGVPRWRRRRNRPRSTS